MVGARRAINSRVGATVVGGREMQATADDRGQQRATMQAIETNVTKEKLKINLHEPYKCTCTVPYIAKYRTVRYRYCILQRTIVIRMFLTQVIERS